MACGMDLLHGHVIHGLLHGLVTWTCHPWLVAWTCYMDMSSMPQAMDLLHGHVTFVSVDALWTVMEHNSTMVTGTSSAQ